MFFPNRWHKQKKSKVLKEKRNKTLNAFLIMNEGSHANYSECIMNFIHHMSNELACKTQWKGQGRLLLIGSRASCIIIGEPSPACLCVWITRGEKERKHTHTQTKAILARVGGGEISTGAHHENDKPAIVHQYHVDGEEKKCDMSQLSCSELLNVFVLLNTLVCRLCNTQSSISSFPFSVEQLRLKIWKHLPSYYDHKNKQKEHSCLFIIIISLKWSIVCFKSLDFRI